MNLNIKLLKNYNYKKNIYLVYFIYILSISLFSLIFGLLLVEKNYFFIDNQNNIILEKTPFFWGELLRNINENFDFYSLVYEKKYYLRKFPLNAFLIVFIFNISKNIFIFLLIKNIFVSSIIFLSIYFFCISKKVNFFGFILLILAFFLVPYNAHVIFHYVYADHLTSFLIPLIFIFLISDIKNKYFIIGVTIFSLYFTKPSVFFICTIIPIIILIIEKNKITKIIPITFALLAVFTWGIYGHYKTGVFPFGTKLLSNNSYDFSVLANKNFLNVYPNKSVDELQQSLDINKFEEYQKFENEWDFYDYFNKKNQDYLRNNFREYLNTIPLKLKFIFFGINKDGIDKDDFEKNGNEIRYSNFINKFLLNLAIIISLYTLIRNYKNFFNQKIEIYYLSILFLNLAPHLYAWATSKHLVGLFILSNIYLIHKFYIFKKFKEN